MDSDTVTQKGIEFLLTNWRERASRKINVNRAMCLGMTYFWLNKDKSVNTLAACHILSDSITGEWRGLNPEDYIDGMKLDTTDEELIAISSTIAFRHGIPMDFITVLRSIGLRRDIEDQLVELSTKQKIHRFDPKDVVVNIIRDESYAVSKPRHHSTIDGSNTLKTFNPSGSNVVGTGSYGTIYSWNRIAVKSTPIMKDWDPLHTSILIEIAILSKLSSSREVIKILGVGGEINPRLKDGMPDAKIHIFMELGVMNLEATINPSDVKIDWLRGIISGLLVMHENDIVHTDIKPQNLVLMPNGNVTIVDFGLSVPFASGTKYEVSGTVNYMEYSMLEYESKLKKTTETGIIQLPRPPSDHMHTGIDVWSLGCTILSLLSGNYPYFYNEKGEQTPESTMHDIESKLLSDSVFNNLKAHTYMKPIIKSMLTINHLNRINLRDLQVEMNKL